MNNIYFNKQVQHLNAILLGTCNVEGLPGVAKRFGYNADHYLYDGRHIPKLPANVCGIYDFAVVAITLRSIMEDCFLGKDDYFWCSKNLEEQDLEKTFGIAVNLINEQVSLIANLLPEMPVFIFSFIEPSSNPLGLLQKKHSLENVMYFIRKLNEQLELSILRNASLHYFDANECLSLIGRESLQDDVLYMCSHGGILSNFDIELDVKNKRIVPPIPALNFFKAFKGGNYIELIWKRLSDSLKIIKKISPVKLIVIDLDDTLWRGIAAEDNMENFERIEGWPMGFVEALLFFKKRGGLLAVNSKNEEKQTLNNLEKIYGGKISKNDFVSIKINWNSKVENLREIIKETNILPQNIVVVDDNPREIDELSGVFPELRHLGFNPYAWRGYILNGPEFQTEAITRESSRRTELVKAKVQREIEQIVLSCRVFGMDIEIVIGYEAVRIIGDSNSIIQGKLILTGKNHSCLNYFERLGFAKTIDDIWETNKIYCEPPDWINIVHNGDDIYDQDNKIENGDKKIIEMQYEITEKNRPDFVVQNNEDINTKIDILKAELIKSKTEAKELQDALDKILTAYSNSQQEILSMRSLLKK
ncbi:MAG: HAD-IIIC family phosphatase [bacterium]